MHILNEVRNARLQSTSQRSLLATNLQNEAWTLNTNSSLQEQNASTYRTCLEV
jgi:hypothetical protein